MNTRAKIIDHYVEKSKEPGFQIDQVRKELEANNVDEEEIRIVMRLVDNEIQRGLSKKANNLKMNELIIVGAVLTLFGAGMTIATFFGIIGAGNSFILAYGPFFGGVALLLSGVAKRRRENE